MQFQKQMLLPHGKTLSDSLCLSCVIKSKLHDLVLTFFPQADMPWFAFHSFGVCENFYCGKIYITKVSI